MSIKRLVLLLVGMAAGTAGFASDAPTGPLTLTQALALFRSNSPALKSVRAHTEAVRSGEITAGLRVNPVFTSANEDFNVFNPAKFDPVNNQEFTDNLGWTFERGGKRQARIGSATATTRIARDTLADTQRQLELQVKTAFVGLLAAKNLVALAQDNLHEYRQTVEASRTRLQAGDISQTDFDRIAIEEAPFQSDLLNAQAAVTQAKTQLAALLGVADSSSLDVVGSLDVPALDLTLERLRQEALANRPDYLAARDSVAKSNADLRLARANGAADFVVAPEYKRNGPDNTLGVTVSFPIRIFDRNQGEKARAVYEVQATGFAETASRLQVLSEVAQSWEGYRTALALAHLYSSDYLERARSVRDRMAFSYQHGATSLLEYLDAVRSYRQIEIAALNANAQAISAVHQLSLVTATELLP